MNEAFRIEAFFLEGDRTNAEEVSGYFLRGQWIVVENEGSLLGCVFVETTGDRGYFGLLAVHPESRRLGLARALIRAAEEACRKASCATVECTVVNLRTELFGFYKKLGYEEAGQRAFTGRSRIPCHLVLLKRRLGRPEIAQEPGL